MKEALLQLSGKFIKFEPIILRSIISFISISRFLSIFYYLKTLDQKLSHTLLEPVIVCVMHY